MMRMDLWFLLTPAGTGTHVHYEGHIAGKGIGKLFTGKMVKMMKEIDGDLLDRLAAQVRRGTKTQPAAKPKAGAKASKKTTARKT